MTTGIVQCNFCEKVVKERDAHGWLDVRVWVTKPTKDAVEQMKMDPSMAQMLERQGITGADLPALVGGDFCCLEHLVRFYQAQAMLESQETTDDEKIALIPESPELEFEAEPVEDWRREVKEEMVTRRDIDGERFLDDDGEGYVEALVQEVDDFEERYTGNQLWDHEKGAWPWDDAPPHTDDDAPPEDDGTLPGDGWLIVGDDEGPASSA